MENKDKVDLLSKKAEIVNKKAILWLAIAGGIGAYTIKFFMDGYNTFGYVFTALLAYSAVGVFVNIMRLGKIERELERIENERI